MRLIAGLLVILVAALHLGFLALETFLWERPLGLHVFGMSAEAAAATAVLAANQGVYNGFLAAGLLWGLLAGKRDVVIFFLLCVIVAGVVGAVTAKPSILFVQAAPAAAALALTLAAGRRPRTNDKHAKDAPR